MWGSTEGDDLQARPPRRGADARSAIERTVAGLGYDLVDVERGQRGLLRVTIDRVPGHTYPDGDGAFITVDDCERVTRQLQHLLEVEGVEYQRLEVSSPGLDRPLRRESDFRRFAGAEVTLTLKEPFQGRKTWRGLLAESPEGGFTLEVHEGKSSALLTFAFGEVREARLVPVVDFKGRRPAPRPGKESPQGAQAARTGDGHELPESRVVDDGGQDR